MYDYLEAMVDDIETVFKDYDWEATNREDLACEMHDKLWSDDAITGNSSGSYTCNANVARAYVLDNEDFCRESLAAFCVEPDEIAKHFLNGDWEYFDCTIRCWLLSRAIEEYLDQNYDDFIIHDINKWGCV